MNLATTTLIRPMAGGPRNGLTWNWKPYVYRGTGADTLTAFMDDEPEAPGPPRRSGLAPCGTEAAYRRHRRHGDPVDEDCRRAGTRAAAKRRAKRARNRRRP